MSMAARRTTRPIRCAGKVPKTRKQRCWPPWDTATGRVPGIEVLPPAVLGRPRVDVTWRISGLFRDMFPTQIALIDAAANAVAARDEEDLENPLAAKTRADGKNSPRIFGTSPGTYGAGV